MPPSKLTPKITEQIAARVAAGSYDYVAAQSCGIAQQTFSRWMKAGKAGHPNYADFYQRVSEAKAKARIIAENAVFRGNPLAWLRYGPGRERPGEPGWTETVQVTGNEGGPVEVAHVELTEDERAERVAILLDIARARRAECVTETDAADEPG